MISHYSGSNFFEVILEIFTISLNFLVPEQIRIKAPRKTVQRNFSLDYQNNLKYIISKEDKKILLLKLAFYSKQKILKEKKAGLLQYSKDQGQLPTSPMTPSVSQLSSPVIS